MDTSACPVLDLAAAPVPASRIEAWNYFRSGGDVFKLTNGDWCVTGVDAVRAVMLDTEKFSNSVVNELEHCPVNLIPEGVDPPHHRRFRSRLNPAFAPQAIDNMTEAIRQQAAALISNFADRGSCDIMTDLARPFPAQVFLTMLGLPLDDRDMLIGWVRGINGHETVPEGKIASDIAKESSEAMARYLTAAIAARRESPTDDLLSQIMAPHDGDTWTEEEVLGFAYQFTLAGLDTVAATSGFVFRYLAENPDVRREVIRDPDLIAPLVEEILRFESIVPFNHRRAVTDVELGGRTIPAGSLVWVSLATANHDESVFPKPDEWDTTRDGGHFSFGTGIHRCIGSHLARRELQVLVEEFHKQIPDYELAPAPVPEIAWPAFVLVLSSVPLRFPVSGS